MCYQAFSFVCLMETTVISDFLYKRPGHVRVRTVAAGRSESAEWGPPSGFRRPPDGAGEDRVAGVSSKMKLLSGFGMKRAAESQDGEMEALFNCEYAALPPPPPPQNPTPPPSPAQNSSFLLH